MVYRDKGLCATDVPMIMRPAPYHGIEQPNHIARCRLCMTFDDLSDIAEKRLHVLGGRCDHDFAVLVFADVLPEKVTPRLNMGNAGFLWREFQPSFLQERLDERLDCMFSSLFGAASDDEVVSPSHQMHFGSAALDGRFGIFLPQLVLQTVEGQVRQDG